MARPIKYRATWSTGEIDTRAPHRVYTHAWRVDYERGDMNGYMAGFAGSQALAERARATHFTSLSRYYAVTGSEVVAVEVL